MKVVFLSNYLTHHQIPFSDEMYSIMDGEYRFVQMEEMTSERKGMGWGIDESRFGYLVKYQDDPEFAQSMIDSADAVIVSGSVSYRYTQTRVNTGRLLIKYDERPFKRSDFEFLLRPRLFRTMLICHRACRHKNVYMLCAGAYVAEDMKRFGAYPGKMFMWGYFPAFFDYGEDGPEKERRSVTQILWCGRYIALKRPMMVVELAEHLKEQGADFCITMIGTGELKQAVEREIKERKLSGYIRMVDSVPYSEMKNYYLDADIFFMTSDRNEGWGAVLNEAMNNGCICVADRMAGAAPWLIRDEENGFLYDDPQEAYKKIDRILEMDEYTVRRIQKNAYDTIRDGWTPRLAAERLKSFIEDPAGFVSPSGGVMRKV